MIKIICDGGMAFYLVFPFQQEVHILFTEQLSFCSVYKIHLHLQSTNITIGEKVFLL